MVSKKSRTEVRVKKHNRMRNHLAGTAQRPRLAVFRSNNHMYCLLYTSPSPRDRSVSRMPSSA